MKFLYKEDAITSRVGSVIMNSECAGEEIFLTALRNMFIEGKIEKIIAEDDIKSVHCVFKPKDRSD